MTREKILCVVIMAVCLGGGLLCFLRRRKAKQALAEADEPTKKMKNRLRLLTILLTVFGWFFISELLTLIFGKGESETISVSLFAPRVQVGSFSLNTTVIITWCAMALLLVLAILVRIFVIPRMTDVPHGIQNVLEIAVSFIDDYTDSQTHHAGLGSGLSSYLFSLALLMIASACVELLGLRAPTADVTMTFAMGLVTFFLINYYGIRKKGVGGRLKSLAQPVAVVLPMKIVSDVAVPVSLACRLFGNMLGGMIVMELLYMAMGNFGLVLPALAGLYFNVFHPLIQVFIFVTLSLTFINEAVE